MGDGVASHFLLGYKAIHFGTGIQGRIDGDGENVHEGKLSISAHKFQKVGLSFSEIQVDDALQYMSSSRALTGLASTKSL